MELTIGATTTIVANTSISSLAASASATPQMESRNICSSEPCSVIESWQVCMDDPFNKKSESVPLEVKQSTVQSEKRLNKLKEVEEQVLNISQARDMKSSFERQSRENSKLQLTSTSSDKLQQNASSNKLTLSFSSSKDAITLPNSKSQLTSSNDKSTINTSSDNSQPPPLSTDLGIKVN